MLRKRLLTAAICTLLPGLLALAGCSPVVPDIPDKDRLAATQTALQEQLDSLRTQAAELTRIAVLTQAVMPTSAQTALPPVPVVPLPTTAVPTSTATATATRVPATTTPVPTATPVPVPCNAAVFVNDVTVPDGTDVLPGWSFTKIWRLKNVGACAWTTDYALVYTSGESMRALAVINLPGTVKKGQMVDLAVDLVAPSKEGSYRGYWKLRDPEGRLFGIGRNNDAFYVDINVSGSASASPLDFVATYCQAEWTSGAGSLTCPGDTSDSRGSVRRIESPVLENGYRDDEPVLLTYPQMINNGVIRGKYPAVRVKDGMHFIAVIGCGYKAESCNVDFQLDFQIGDDSIQTLAVWNEVYDEQFNLVDVDLSHLEGDRINFILTVRANGPATQDRAQWLAPHITEGE